MRILIITDCYYPTSKSGAKLVHDLGVEFRRRGHDVIILASSEYIREGFEFSSESGMQIARVKTGKMKSASKIVRALNEIRLSHTMWKGAEQFLRANPWDYIVYYSPSIFFGPLVRRLKSLWKCPSYLILRDIFPQWAVDMGVLRKGLIYAYFRRRELEQYSVADVIGVQSPDSLRYFANNLPEKNYRLEVVFNWTTLTEENVPNSNYRQQLSLQDKVVFFYGGNIGVAQDLDNILRLAGSLKDEAHIYFLLVGSGSEVDRLNSEIKRMNLRNIQILPPVDQQEYLGMLAEFDVGLISLDRRLKTTNIPGKLLGYMYHSKPVLASLNPGNDLEPLLEKSEAGWSAVNGDDPTLKQNALQLAADPALRRRLGKNSRRLLEETFSVAAAADKILGHVERSVTNVS
jgi:glycosyltransferase involved in cell wall biosynthesis